MGNGKIVYIYIYIYIHIYIYNSKFLSFAHVRVCFHVYYRMIPWKDIKTGVLVSDTFHFFTKWQP